MTDLVLIQPPLSRKDRYGVLSSGGSCLPPFGLAWLAAVARDRGYSVSIIDSEAQLLSCHDVVEEILALEPKIVGITATTISVGRAGDVAKALVSAGCRAPLLIGGPHVTAVPEETLKKFSEFSVAVLGEGEKTILELIPALLNDDSVSFDQLNAIDGLAFFDTQNTYHRTQPRAFLTQDELNALPLPAFDLLPPLNSAYQPSALRSHQLPSSSLITTRGCGGKCTFCDNTVFGNKVRSFSSDYIMAMVECLHKDYGIKDITFYDDNFVVNKKRLNQFCSQLSQRFPDMSWSCNARVDIITPELIETVKSAGCWQMSVGIESGEQAILDAEFKGITLPQVTSAVTSLSKAGIKTKGFFMIGHPGETEASVKKTMDLALSLPLDDFQMSFLTPFPGTCIHGKVESYGVLYENWDEMNMWTPVFIPEGFTRERLIELQALALSRFYFRPRIILRYLKICVTTPSVASAVFRGGLSLLRGVFSSKRRGVESHD